MISKTVTKRLNDKSENNITRIRKISLLIIARKEYTLIIEDPLFYSPFILSDLHNRGRLSGSRLYIDFENKEEKENG